MPCAVKTMRQISEENVKTFKHEINLTAHLRHPNVVQYIGACWGRELVCLVLEWVARGSLSEVCSNSALDLKWNDPLLKLATDIARGFVYLHGREYFDEADGQRKHCVMHRDLKAENVLVTDFMSAKVSDFGSSKVKASEDCRMTLTGTPIFMSPECGRGEHYDEKSDIYSFGLLLLDLAVEEGATDFIGKRWCNEFNKDSVPTGIAFNRVLAPIWDDGWRPVTASGGEIPFAPPSIVNLIIDCCNHNPRERPTFEQIFNRLVSDCLKDIESTVYLRKHDQAGNRFLVMNPLSS